MQYLGIVVVQFVVLDGLACLATMTEAGCRYQVIIVGSCKNQRHAKIPLDRHYNEQSQDPPHHVRVRPHQGGQSNHSDSHLLKLELLRRVK